MKRLFDKIQGLLKQRRISQAEFSRKIQVSPQRYSKWLHGTGEPGPLSLLRMARELNVTMESLVDEELEPTPAFTPESLEILNLVRDLGGRDALLRQIESASDHESRYRERAESVALAPRELGD